MVLYVIIGIFLLIVVVLFLGNSKKTQQQQKIDRIRTDWAKPFVAERNFNLIAAYHTALKNEVVLTDEVADDIDLDSVFDFVDRTYSKLGQQYLYNKLRSTEKDIAALTELDNLAELFKADQDARFNTALELAKLDHKNAYYIHELFTSTYHTLYKNWLAVYIRLAGFLWIAVLVLTIVLKSQVFFLLCLGLTFFNFYLHYTNKKKIARYVHSLPQLYLLMQTGKGILKLVDTSFNIDIANRLKQLGSLKKTLGLINFQDQANRDPTDIGAGVMELIKTLLVVEPAMFLASVNKIRQQRDNIEALFNYIAKIDVSISILCLRSGLPYYCKPDFNGLPNQLEVVDLFHPTVANCVPNSLTTVASKGVLVTGSNMSGKTTFIRSIAINTLLAQTLFTCCAATYRAPFMQVFTSIRINDDLTAHKSYFQAEALSVLDILEKSTGQGYNLIIIDEIFRGTNTIERIAAAKAILSHLTAQQNFVLVSTHDLELAELLGSAYTAYSFEEIAADTRLIFDYKIKPGILKNKNGIAILSAMGYPTAVVDDALAISAALREKYNI